MKTIAALALAGLAAVAASAGNLTLKPETLDAWQEYVRGVSEGMQGRAQSARFLWVDEQPQRIQNIRRGEIVVAPGGSQPHKVPAGLIHHWIGAAFFPNTSLDELLTVVRDYSHYKDHYKPIVLDSRMLSLGQAEDRFSVLFMNKSVVLKTAIDGTYKSSTFRLGPRRAYSFTQSITLQEIENYGTPEEHKLPVDQGSGLIWRLFSVTRYEERDGGVYFEIEALALSREIPFGLRWMIDPIVRRISRSSLMTSIQQTKDAARSEEAKSHRPGGSSVPGRDRQ